MTLIKVTPRRMTLKTMPVSESALSKVTFRIKTLCVKQNGINQTDTKLNAIQNDTKQNGTNKNDTRQSCII